MSIHDYDPDTGLLRQPAKWPPPLSDDEVTAAREEATRERYLILDMKADIRDREYFTVAWIWKTSPVELRFTKHSAREDPFAVLGRTAQALLPFDRQEAESLIEAAGCRVAWLPWAAYGDSWGVIVVPADR